MASDNQGRDSLVIKGQRLSSPSQSQGPYMQQARSSSSTFARPHGKFLFFYCVPDIPSVSLYRQDLHLMDESRGGTGGPDTHRISQVGLGSLEILLRTPSGRNWTRRVQLLHDGGSYTSL